jgi:hypothetical protein
VLEQNALARLPADQVKPVVKFFNPVGAATWLFTELDADGDTLYGLCDLGMQCPELGYASLSEIEAVTLRFKLKIERDLWFKASKTLAEYADDARSKGRIDA